MIQRLISPARPHLAILLVIDAANSQNAIRQAEVFTAKDPSVVPA